MANARRRFMAAVQLRDRVGGVSGWENEKRVFNFYAVKQRPARVTITKPAYKYFVDVGTIRNYNRCKFSPIFVDFYFVVFPSLRCLQNVTEKYEERRATGTLKVTSYSRTFGNDKENTARMERVRVLRRYRIVLQSRCNSIRRFTRRRVLIFFHLRDSRCV